jgi:hypothetical protein
MSSSKKLALYRTSDIYFAAYLCSIELEMVTTEQEAGGDGNRKLVFVFRIPSSDIGRLKASFFGGYATVKVRTFVDNLRALKSMVYT